MTEKNSIIKEALLDIKNIESAINSNTKEMLRGVAREEIDSIVKESLMREIYEEEDLEAPEGLGGGEDLGLEPAGLDSLGGEEDSTGGLGDIDSPIGGEETGLEMGAGLEPELGMDPVGLGGDEMDMTAASDDEVIAIYKKMSGEDEIEIVGDEVHLNISEPGQYVVKLDDSTGPAPMGGLDSLEGGEDTGIEGGDDAEYEIELDDESGEEEPAFGGEEDSEEAPDDLVSVDGGEEESEEETEDDTEEEIDEQAVVGSAQAHRLQARQTAGAPLGAGADNLKESEKAKALLSETVNKYNTLVNESNQKIEEYKTAYSYVKNKLMETVLLNTKLTYVTKLFTENSTTKAEKESILQRFDEVTTVAESKKLKKVIDNELGSRQPITESIDNKFTKGATTSTSKQLNESTAYVDPSIKRIMDLINRVENK